MGIDDAQLSNEEFDIYFNEVDIKRENKLTKDQVKQLIINIAKFWPKSKSK